MCNSGYFYKAIFSLLIVFITSASQANTGDLKTDTVLVSFGGVFTEVFDAKIQAAGNIAEETTLEKKVLLVEGYMAEMKGNAYREITLRNQQGEKLEMVWMLDGKHRAERGIAASKWLNRKVRVSYEATPCYLPKEGVYSNILRVTGIQIIED